MHAWERGQHLHIMIDIRGVGALVDTVPVAVHKGIVRTDAACDWPPLQNLILHCLLPTAINLAVCRQLHMHCGQVHLIGC